VQLGAQGVRISDAPHGVDRIAGVLRVQLQSELPADFAGAKAGFLRRSAEINEMSFDRVTSPTVHAGPHLGGIYGQDISESVLISTSVMHDDTRSMAILLSRSCARDGIKLVSINNAATVSKEPKFLTESPLDVKAPIQTLTGSIRRLIELPPNARRIERRAYIKTGPSTTQSLTQLDCRVPPIAANGGATLIRNCPEVRT